ncbi:MAG TPA: hypothetical protein VJA16_04175 [Thermoanaerobaculia bacterium]
MSFVEKVEQWNRDIAGSFDRAFSDLRRQLQERVRESHQDLDRRIEAFAPPLPVLAHEDLAPAADRLRGEARADALGELRDALAALDRARSQSAVLAALIAGTAGFASRAAVLLSRGGELRGWGGQGFGDAEHRLPDVTLTPPAGSPWGSVAPGEDGAGGGAGGTGASARLSAAECAVLCGRIESPVPAYGVLVPLVLRDRTVAVLYADQLPEMPEMPVRGDAAPGQASGLSLPALQSLVYVAALAIESLPFRQREATATLQPAGAAGETGVPVAAAATVATVATVATAAAAAEPASAAAEATAPAAGEKIAEAPAEGAVPGPAGTGMAAAEATAAAAPVSAPEKAAAGSPGAAAPTDLETPAAPGTSTVAETTETAETTGSAAPAPSVPATESGATPFAVTPAALYDAPRVPVLKETAEIPTRPLRPVPPLSPAAAASIPHGAESPYLDEAAASGAPAAITAIVPGIGGAGSAAATTESAPAGAGGHETVLLPRTGLRDAAGAPWGRGEAPAPITPSTPATPDTQATAAAPHGAAAGLGTLRVVPSVPPKAAAGPGSAGVSGVTAGTNPGTILPPPALTSVPPPSPASPLFEPLRTGPLGSGTPEVRPPTGVQGPGWAFATTRIQASSSEEALHEEARRLARLLVSEIKLYNEEQVEAGRRNRDIYERLREDIDRSRQMYEERVDPRLVKSTDYFYQELVRILAAGDSKALGI